MKEKLIPILIVLITWATITLAMTMKNCGNSTLLSGSANDGFMIAFDPNTVINNCEVDFDDVEQNYWFTACWGNLPQRMGYINNSTSVFMWPKTSMALSGLIGKFVCTTSTTEGR